MSVDQTTAQTANDLRRRDSGPADGANNSRAPRTFQSILGPEGRGAIISNPSDVPPYLRDLAVDRIIDAIIGEWNSYDLRPFYLYPLDDLDLIAYRQEVMKDLEDKALMQSVKSFAAQMKAMRDRLGQLDEARRYEYPHAARRLFLGAAKLYCDAVGALSRDLSALVVNSRGFQSLRRFLAEYVDSTAFQRFSAEASNLTADLSKLMYCILLKDDTVTVRRYEAEADYTVSVEETFEKFRRDEVTRYRLEAKRGDGMNHIFEQIQAGVASLYPELFRALDGFTAAHAQFLDATITRFDREIHFYIAYLAYVERFRAAGLAFCQPVVSKSKAIRSHNAFDAALAHKLIGENTAVVCNDFYLTDSERIFVVTGANQGGKTTFARMIGQLHHFACLGCLVPGTDASLFLVDHISTHFEREEHIANLRGKLQDDLERIHRILSSATENSLLLMNELFSSTTLHDAAFLSKQVMEKISELDSLCVWVTFLDEMASFSNRCVSMVSTVNPENPVQRTFRVERKPADGLAYAMAIARKYGVTYESLKERIKE